MGSSNLKHNYDYNFLNKSFQNFDVIGCNLNEPSGVFPTLHKLKQLNPDPDDIIVLCFPHSFYEKDKHFPVENLNKRGVNYTVLMSFIDEFPIDFLNKFFSNKAINSYKILTNRRKSQEKSITHYREQPTITKDSLWNSCWVNTEKKFFIKSLTFEKKYIEQLLEYVSNEFEGYVYFRFPAIRKNDYTINQNRLLYLKETGLFLNDFNSSIYQDEYWFDQWYHLNKCGRDLSTQKLIVELKNTKARAHNNVYE